MAEFITLICLHYGIYLQHFPQDIASAVLHYVSPARDTVPDDSFNIITSAIEDLGEVMRFGNPLHICSLFSKEAMELFSFNN